MSAVNAQPGIFALGTPEHAYLEFDLRPGARPVDLVAAAAGLVEPLSTTGGVNLVVGFRPELWAEVADPADVPEGRTAGGSRFVGPDGWTMPATQHDAWLWVAGGNRTAVFDNGRAIVRGLGRVAELRRETGGWHYRHDRDLTGFIDGTENPSLLAAPGGGAGPGGRRGRAAACCWCSCGSTTPTPGRRWPTSSRSGSSAGPSRTASSSTRRRCRADSHVARTSVDADGRELEIFRRNTATGTVSAHGTVFVGFCAEQEPLAEMLRRMAGLGDGVRDALTRYTRPVTGGLLHGALRRRARPVHAHPGDECPAPRPAGTSAGRSSVIDIR